MQNNWMFADLGANECWGIGLAVTKPLSDRFTLFRMVVSARAFRWLRNIIVMPFAAWRLGGTSSDELLIAPRDIKTAVPTFTDDYYSGHFSFAGTTVKCIDFSPFERPPPNLAWYRKLAEFGWLRHLRAANTEIARTQGRIHVDDWIRIKNKLSDPAWEPSTTAMRVISWISHSPLLLEGCDHPFYSRFMRSLTKQVRYLRLVSAKRMPSLSRLYVAIALAYATICLKGQDKFQKNALRRLSEELNIQILPDGGHISRNPQVILELLTLLLPLRQALIARNLPADDEISKAIDRMMPMLRFFRLGDGNFAHFNGMGDTQADLLATILAYDDANGKPIMNAAYSGYQRFEGGDVIAVMETGKLPALIDTGQMHAGCLSFEMTDGRDRLIVNCGHSFTPSKGIDFHTKDRLVRTTATHSTLQIANASSGRFIDNENYDALLGSPILSGPRDVKVSRTTEDNGTQVTASHDGYVAPFGIRHNRIISLNDEGTVLTGRDEIVSSRGKPLSTQGNLQFQIRFHLHPSVKFETPSADTVELTLPSGNRWLFSCRDLPLKLADSIALADNITGHQTTQILIEGSTKKISEINWALQRLS